MEIFIKENEALLLHREEVLCAAAVSFSAGNYRTYEYDSANRQTAVNLFAADGSQTMRTEYAYDPAGNLTVMKDYRYTEAGGLLYRYTQRQYDGFGRMIGESEIDCSGSEPTEEELASRRISYTYDDNNRLTEVTYPEGFDSQVSKLAYVYGDYGRLQKIQAVTAAGTKDLRIYTYDAMGYVATIQDDRSGLGGTGYTLKSYSYDRLERPISITVTDSEKSGEVEKYTYAYDKNGQIVTETKKNFYPESGIGRIDKTWEYTYDPLGRLLTTIVTDNQSGEVKTQKAYTYDGAGNRLTETENGVQTVNTYNSLNQLIQSGSSSFVYDANGNLKQENVGNVIKNYTYDADNRLASAVFTENGVQKLQQENVYNGEGQRIAKTENDQTTRYSYQDGSLVYTSGGEENQSLNLLDSGGEIIAAERESETGKTYVFYNKDVRASTTTVLDESGEAKVTYIYSDFGETEADSDFYNEICYTGGIWDSSTGLYYLNARYYDPETGRFLSEDTYRGTADTPQMLHLYVYCANNPVNYVDPSGNVWETVLDVASVGWSAAKFLAAPSWKAAGYLIWDISATFIPFVPGSYVKKGLNAAGKIKKLRVKVPTKVTELRQGKYLVVGSYSALRKIYRGAKKRKNIELHHIIEKRFSKVLNVSPSDWPCVALDKKLHRVITNRFKEEFSYSKKGEDERYKRISYSRMVKIVNRVYYDMPELRKIALDQVRRTYKYSIGGVR